MSLWLGPHDNGFGWQWLKQLELLDSHVIIFLWIFLFTRFRLRTFLWDLSFLFWEIIFMLSLCPDDFLYLCKLVLFNEVLHKLSLFFHFLLSPINLIPSNTLLDWDNKHFPGIYYNVAYEQAVKEDSNHLLCFNSKDFSHAEHCYQAKHADWFVLNLLNVQWLLI